MEINATAKIWKMGKELVLKLSKEHTPALEKLRGKDLIVTIATIDEIKKNTKINPTKPTESEENDSKRNIGNNRTETTRLQQNSSPSVVEKTPDIR